MGTHQFTKPPSITTYSSGCRCDDCRNVQSAYDKARYPQEQERRKLNAKLWREANPQLHKKQNALWYQRNRETVKARTAEWQAAHPERVKVYRESDKAKASDKRWRKRNPEKVRAWIRRRKITKRHVVGSHTTTEWVAILEQFDYLCAHCGTSKNITQDHIIPISKGGTDYASNLQPLCRSCNSRKHDKLTTNREPKR